MAPPDGSSSPSVVKARRPASHDDHGNVESKSSTNTTTKSSPETAATPNEVIEQQHLAAQQLIRDGLLHFSKPDWQGEIPLSAKQCPAVEATAVMVGVSSKQEEDDAPVDDPCESTTTIPSSSIPCWSSRGQVDVTALQDLVRTGYNRSYPSPSSSPPKAKAAAPVHQQQRAQDNGNSGKIKNYWDPVYAAKHNVAICRPAHDAWGIPKIVLLFCDDFLHDCYELPWWDTFAPALQPILQCLNVPASRVVRALLASLPAGATIPVHYDTGEWVRYTHRIHVPVLVHNVSQIVFTCGNHAIECQPGHVFEINNQCQHAVSNCDSEYRVHLILDYVDADFPFRQPRIRLQQAEVLWQTRRSIDRQQDAGQRPTPSFLILGAQKAGTTFLFELLCQHPWIVPPKHCKRETHCLDWRWNEALKSTQQRVRWCRQFYHYDELQRHPSCQTGDSTPSYLLDSRRVIPRLREAFAHSSQMKFLVTCRDPIRRAESHYAMVTSPVGTLAQLQARGTEWRTQTLDDVVWGDLCKLQDCGVLPYWSSFSSLSSRHFWEATFDATVFDSFTGSTAEDAAWGRYLEQHVPLNTGSYGILSRGLYELQLRPWLREFDGPQFLVLKLEAMTSTEARDQECTCLPETITTLWQHLDLPHCRLSRHQTPKNARDYQQLLSNATREFLQRFYEPHNQKLQQVLMMLTHQESIPSYIQSTLKQHWSETWQYSS